MAVERRVILAPTQLALSRGRVTGIIGRNGSGKSTLLKCLARQLTPSQGRVVLEERPAQDWSARAFARKLGYLPQQAPAATGLTGDELVAFGRYPWRGALGRMGRHDREAVAEAMALADTTEFADRLVDRLSGGERQRVWITMLIAQETDFLLLDEPIAALDLAHQIEVLSLLRALSRRRDSGIVVVLHDINMAARFCDDIVALRDGAIVAQGPPYAVLQPDLLETIFGVTMRLFTDDAAGVCAYVPA